MDDVYLLEIRLGRTKWRIREMVVSIARQFRIEKFMERHPHVTLFGPMELLPGVREEQILETIGTIASRYEPPLFTLDRFEKREGMHGSVIAFSVHPSDNLKQLVREIAFALLPLTKSHNAWDDKPEQKWYHVTVANRLDQKRAARVFSSLLETEDPAHPYVKPEGFIARFLSAIRSCIFFRSPHPVRPFLIDEAGLRITMMHGEQILAEYDLLEKCWIYENSRHDSSCWQETLARLRKHTGFELTKPDPADPDDILLIADLHLGHANIIR